MQRTQDAGGACVNAGGSGRRWNFESVEHPRLSACPECNAALDHVSSYNKGMLRLISNHIHETMYVVHGYECANGHRVSSKIHTTIWASAYKRPTVPALMRPPAVWRTNPVRRYGAGPGSYTDLYDAGKKVTWSGNVGLGVET